jgi:putative ABC transport system ATP-binding protein
VVGLGSQLEFHSRKVEEPDRETWETHMIELECVTKMYSMGSLKVAALQGVSLSIKRGEMVAIMGPSGSGKSTMMNIVGCLDVPTSGRYLLEGQDVGRLGDDRLAEIRNREIGFVFQTYNLLPRLTALANVELPLLYGVGHNRRKLALEALEKVGLVDRADHHPSEMSGGEQQRVGIARALAKKPAILLADEPTGNLDSRSSEEILAIVRQLNVEEGITVIIVTHELSVAAHTSRTISMLDGAVVRDELTGKRRKVQVSGMGQEQP